MNHLQPFLGLYLNAGKQLTQARSWNKFLAQTTCHPLIQFAGPLLISGMVATISYEKNGITGVECLIDSEGLLGFYGATLIHAGLATENTCDGWMVD